MAVTITIDTTQKKETFSILNSSEINLDLSYNQFSPNPTFVSAFVAQFVCTPSEDPISFIKESMANFGVSKNLEATLNFDTFTKVKGQLKLGSPDNSFITGQGQKSQFNIKFEPYPNTFFDRSENLSIISFSKQTDWTNVSYVTERNSVLEDFILLVVTTQTLIQAAQAVYNLGDSIKEAISTGFDTASAIIKFAIKTALNLAYTVAILIALNELLKQASEILFDKPKKLYGLDVWKTIKQGCTYLGYEFKSSLEETFKDLVFVSATTVGGRTTGQPINIPLPNYSFLQFIENIGALFNAKLKVISVDGIDKVIFETTTFYTKEDNVSDIKLQELYNNGDVSFNFEELPEEIAIIYAKVDGDNNYKTNYYKESYQLKGDNKLFGTQNKITIDLPFAKAEPKQTQSSAEKIFNSIFDLLTGLSKGYKTNIGDRLGFWKLEQNIVPVDTIFIRESDGRVNDNTLNILSPQYLFNNFYINETPLNNQYTIVKNRGKQPICGENSNELLTNNVIRDDEGKPIIVTKNLRQSQDGLYDIEYRRKVQDGDFGYVSEDLITTVKTNVSSGN
jgi:hypothetical protein